MSIDKTPNRAELAKQSAMKVGREFLQRAGAPVPPRDYTRAQDALESMDAAIDENGVQFQDALRKFVRIVGETPFVERTELFNLANDSLVPMYREWRNLTHST